MMRLKETKEVSREFCITSEDRSEDVKSTLNVQFFFNEDSNAWELNTEEISVLNHIEVREIFELSKNLNDVSEEVKKDGDNN